jgi:DNA transposition AAA+ family ATPase
VVPVGLPTLEYKIRNLHNNHEQLISRVGVMVKLGRLKKTDVEKIITRVWSDPPGGIIDAFVKGANGSTCTLKADGPCPPVDGY